MIFFLEYFTSYRNTFERIGITILHWSLNTKYTTFYLIFTFDLIDISIWQFVYIGLCTVMEGWIQRYALDFAERNNFSSQWSAMVELPWIFFFSAYFVLKSSILNLDMWAVVNFSTECPSRFLGKTYWYWSHESHN